MTGTDELTDALDRLERKRSAASVSSIPWSRLFSSALAGIYVVLAFTGTGQLAGIRMLWFCVLPVLCIWFPDDLSEFVGGRITRGSPPRFVLAFGWLVLLLPLIAMASWYIAGVARTSR